MPQLRAKSPVSGFYEVQLTNLGKEGVTAARFILVTEMQEDRWPRITVIMLMTIFLVERWKKSVKDWISASFLHILLFVPSPWAESVTPILGSEDSRWLDFLSLIPLEGDPFLRQGSETLAHFLETGPHTHQMCPLAWYLPTRWVPCLAQYSCLPGTSNCDLIWKEHLCGCH